MARPGVAGGGGLEDHASVGATCPSSRRTTCPSPTPCCSWCTRRRAAGCRSSDQAGIGRGLGWWEAAKHSPGWQSSTDECLFTATLQFVADYRPDSIHLERCFFLGEQTLIGPWMRVFFSRAKNLSQSAPVEKCFSRGTSKVFYMQLSFFFVVLRLFFFEGPCRFFFRVHVAVCPPCVKCPCAGRGLCSAQGICPPTQTGGFLGPQRRQRERDTGQEANVWRHRSLQSPAYTPPRVGGWLFFQSDRLGFAQTPSP